MDPILAHLAADHIIERNMSERVGHVVYVIAKDGMFLRAGEIFINPIVYKYVHELAALTGDGSMTLAIHWLDQSPAEHAKTCPMVTVANIVMHSLSVEIIATCIRRHRQRMERIAQRN